MKILSIQYLRAAAALSVVLIHSSTSLLRDSSLIPLDFGQYGVDLFFVISGFIMYFTTAGTPITASSFWARRAIRIWPLYFLLSTLALAMGIFLKGKVNSFSGSPVEYLKSLLFIPFLNSMTGDVKPLIGQGWTLNYEVFFYAVFGLTLSTGRTSRLVICCGALSALALLGSFLAAPGPVLGTYTNSIILEFVWGMLIAYAIRVDRRCIPLLAWIVLPLGLALTALSAVLGVESAIDTLGATRSIVIGIPCMAIILAAVLLEEHGTVPRWSFPLLVGEASYSLYLVHGFVLGSIRQVWVRLFDSQSAATHLTFIVFGTACCVATSIILYLGFEKRSTKLLSGLARRPFLPAALQPAQK